MYTNISADKIFQNIKDANSTLEVREILEEALEGLNNNDRAIFLSRLKLLLQTITRGQSNEQTMQNVQIAQQILEEAEEEDE